MIEPAERGVRDAEIRQRDWIVRAHATRAFEQRERLRVAAALVGADRDEIERVDLARRFAQDFEERLLGFEDPAAFGEVSRRRDARRDRRQCGSFSHGENADGSRSTPAWYFVYVGGLPASSSRPAPGCRAKIEFHDTIAQLASETSR
jgi:hypothetical protein